MKFEAVGNDGTSRFKVIDEGFTDVGETLLSWGLWCQEVAQKGVGSWPDRTE